MIAVLLYGSWLRHEDVKAWLLGVPEEIGCYSSYEELLAHKDQIEILLSTGDPDEEAIRQMKNLRWIFSYSAGVETYPLDLIRDRGIRLTNASGTASTNMAEQVLGGMILFSRNFLQAMAQKADRAWRRYPVDELTGRELLVIGTGRVGTEIARKARAFDMNVSGVRLSEGRPEPPYFDALYPVSRLDEALAGRHYVCAALPSTGKTVGLIGDGQFRRMDPGAVFINVGRGDAVDQEALARALREQTIRGAMLDVFEEEPLPKESPLWDLPNLVITPHNSGLTPHYAERALKLFRASLAIYRAGGDLPNLVDPDRRY